MRDYVRRLLAERYEVEAVADGEAALDAARARRPDLVLSDVMMPRLDGFGLLRGAARRPRAARVPVILLSARAGEEASIEGLEAGADDYLVKPFSARELLARVRTNIELAGEAAAPRGSCRTASCGCDRFSPRPTWVSRGDHFRPLRAGEPEILQIVGRSMEELLGMRLIELTYSEDVSRFNELLERMSK